MRSLLRHLPAGLKDVLRAPTYWALTLAHRLFLNRLHMRRNEKRSRRLLEIGPGPAPLPEFETLNVVGGFGVDYVLDASGELPFAENTFDVVYASHVLEHVPWYSSGEILREWVRILKPGGRLEVWVPDGLKIAQVFIDVSEGRGNERFRDGWTLRNPREDPFLWVNGRLFYGARGDYPSWHKAVFSQLFDPPAHRG